MWRYKASNKDASNGRNRLKEKQNGKRENHTSI